MNSENSLKVKDGPRFLRCNAVVERSSATQIWLKPASIKACESCIGKSRGCIATAKGQQIVLPVTADHSYQVGEQVTVLFNERELIKINLVWFGIPLIALIMMIFAVGAFSEVPSDWQIIKMGSIALLGGFLLAKSIIKWRSKRLPFWILE
jgi:positive regulator of sigma E activity